jgi:hypothetical protein
LELTIILFLHSFYLVEEKIALCFCFKFIKKLAADLIFSLSRRLALFTLCSRALWWLKRRQPVSASLVASRLNGRRRATLSQNI